MTRTLGSSDIIELMVGLDFPMRVRKPLTTSRHVVRPENSTVWTILMVASRPSKAMVGLAPLTATMRQERKSDIKSVIEYKPCIAAFAPLAWEMYAFREPLLKRRSSLYKRVWIDLSLQMSECTKKEITGQHDCIVRY